MLLLLALEFAEDFFGNYRGSLRWAMNLHSGRERNYRYAKEVLLKKERIDQEKNNLLLTDVGRNKLLEQFPLLEWRKKKWDGFWRVVMYDFPETEKGKRDSLRNFLKKLGFAQWQISVWVSPHPVIDKLDKLLIKQGIRDYCSAHKSKRVVGIPDNEFAQKIWRLDEINTEYRKIMKNYDEKRRSEYLDELMKDPFLPKELLPDDYLWTKVMKKASELPT
ncbi:CRISPR-associated endonuclease Cas2 [Patescibacteria group bacterium]|nr:CRISPR-associated endonuclease Cas2 [Patescibacteria group bacterium]